MSKSSNTTSLGSFNETLEPSVSDFPYKAPKHFIHCIDTNDPDDPLLKQIQISDAELVETVGFANDPVADLDNNPQPSIIHKYHGRVLLIASPKCDIHCRYCFRRHFPYSDHVNVRHWQKAMDYIKADKSLHEVILSGGDPMALNDQSFMAIIEQVENISHVKTIRIHSRTPVVAPDKAIGQPFLDWFENSRLKVVLVVHCNHANELSEQTQRLLSKYRKAGITLLNQSVLLKGVNDNADVLADLSHKLFDQGVLPYYLNQLDRVQGSAHFEVSDDKARQLHQALKCKLPGYLVPKLVKDIAGKGHKTNLN